MKIKKVSHKPTDPTLVEAAIDLGPDYNSSVYSDHDKLEKIKDRKTDVARAIESARAAKARAQKAGNEEAVKKLDALISQLQAWFDGTKGDIRGDSGAQNDSEGGGSNTNSQGQKPSQGPEKPEEPKEPEESEEPKNPKEKDKPVTDVSKGSEEEPEENKDTDEEGSEELDNRGSDDKDLDEPTDEPTDDKGPTDKPADDDGQIDGPISQDQPAPEKKPGEKGEEAEGQAEDSRDNDEDSEGQDEDQGEGAEGQNDQEDSQEDDEPRGNTPKIKDNKIQVNPFSKKIGTAQQLPEIIKKAITDGQLEVEDEWEAFKRIVSGLKGDAREGAKKAISDYMHDSHGIDLSLGETFSAVKGISLSEAMAKLQAMMSEE